MESRVDKMRVHLSTNYVPVSNDIVHGGVERVISNLVMAGMEREEETVIYGVETSNPIKCTKYFEIYPSNIQSLRRREYKSYDAIMEEANRQIFRSVTSTDIIHDHFGFFTTSKYGEKILKKQKIIVTIYGMPDNEIYTTIYGKLKNLKKKYKNLCLVCCSNDQKALFEENGFYIDGVVYNSIMKTDSKKFQIMEYYISLGTLIPEKGHEQAINFALKHKIKLIIIGNSIDVEYREKIIDKKFITLHLYNDLEFNKQSLELVTEALKKKDFVYIENCPESIKRILLKNMKALIFMPSWREPFAMSILEAISSGKPIIHNATPSIIEAVGNVAGIKFDENEVLKKISEFKEEEILSLGDKYLPENALIQYDKYLEWRENELV
jgi:glycosyltransferase involved in cell wall biosynthesis